MYNLYTVTKKKSNILGLWKDKSGKIYRDKIKIIQIKNHFLLNAYIEKMINDGEKEVFYSINNLAFTESKIGLENCFCHKITWKEKKLKPSYVKELLKIHNGITIYKENHYFKIEIWKN
jgi:hypothetical protein